MHAKIAKRNFSNVGSAFVKRVRKVSFCKLGNFKESGDESMV